MGRWHFQSPCSYVGPYDCVLANRIWMKVMYITSRHDPKTSHGTFHTLSLSTNQIQKIWRISWPHGLGLQKERAQITPQWTCAEVGKLTDYATQKYASLAGGLFWAEGKWEKAGTKQDLWLPSIYLKTEYKLPLWRCPFAPNFLYQEKGNNLNQWTWAGTEKESTQTNLQARPYLLSVSPDICLPAIWRP